MILRRKSRFDTRWLQLLVRVACFISYINVRHRNEVFGAISPLLTALVPLKTKRDDPAKAEGLADLKVTFAVLFTRRHIRR